MSNGMYGVRLEVIKACGLMHNIFDTNDEFCDFNTKSINPPYGADPQRSGTGCDI